MSEFNSSTLIAPTALETTDKPTMKGVGLEKLLASMTPNARRSDTLATTAVPLQSDDLAQKETFNELISVRQLIDMLNWDELPKSGSISAKHNIVLSDDHQSWTDNGTGESGTAYDLVAALHPKNCEAMVEAISQSFLSLSPEEREAFQSTIGDFDAATCEFPLACLPGTLGRMAEAIIEMEGVPPVMAACAVIGAASSSLGNSIEIESKTDKTARGNLFILLDAPSGVGKSGTSDRAARPIRDFDKANHAKREKQRQEVAAEIAMKERLLNGATQANEVGSLAGELEALRRKLHRLKSLQRVLVGDTTTEKLAVLCQDNEGSIASFSGEARGIVQVLSGRYQQNNANDSFYLAAFSEDGFQQDRMGRASVDVERPCVSIMWMVQPDAFSKMWANESFMVGGLLPRFLSCRTNARIAECCEERKVFPLSVKEDYNRTITDLLETYWSNKTVLYTVKASPTARRIIIRYANRIIVRRNAKEFSGKADPFAARWAELTWKLALVFHAAEHGKAAHDHEVSAETAMSALTVVSWFAVQEITLLDEHETTQTAMVEMKIFDLVNRVGRVTARALVKAGHVKTSAEAHEILERLRDGGLLASEHTPLKKNGRPTRYYFKPLNNKR